MSRTLFDVGSQGQLIVGLQTSLKNRGFDPKGSDGMYGNDTASAVRAYQASASHPQTGAITDEEWTGVTGAPPPDLEARVLQLTSTFEGHGFGLAEGNWDGAWLTWGIVGFTLKAGEVQAIITGIAQSAPSLITDAFGSDANQLLQIVRAPAAEQEAWANRLTTGAHLAEPWRTHFQWFGTFPEVQRAQCDRVHREFFLPAVQSATALGLASELGIALCFDIHVQSGPVGTTLKQRLAQATAGAPESQVREALANAIADRASPRFRDDVRARKLTIARGQGTVHGREVILARWGLAEVPAVLGV